MTINERSTTESRVLRVKGYFNASGDQGTTSCGALYVPNLTLRGAFLSYTLEQISPAYSDIFDPWLPIETT